MDPNRSVGEPTMHLCHYPNCGKIYKVTHWTGLSGETFLENDIFRKPRIYELTSGGTLVISLISAPGQVNSGCASTLSLSNGLFAGCSRKFTRSDELHRHFRIHTGERKHR